MERKEEKVKEFAYLGYCRKTEVMRHMLKREL